ncbi:hypothetical protein Sipo8835_11790 [Streptomyces ipomoeae]|uniref:Uncharacterized protein n=1 Tax=Streptomyces ipomoeae TaxID=103232 RepID=A0AAE9B0W5_9ACTN|nr:hypothetical protein [Streptomyces ipomoeae]TQE35891.1 hypothetical protein Sipo8835_11790 [Streptomyces ipomoeae]
MVPDTSVTQNSVLACMSYLARCAIRSYDADSGGLDELCDRIVAVLVPDREQTTDDAALLVIRTRGTAAGDVVTYDLPDDPKAAGQARAEVRHPLAA